MTGSSRFSMQNSLTWSKSEKAIARKAYDAALRRELHEVLQEAKHMARRIQQPPDLWDLEQYLAERRKEIDRKYDFRSSQLTRVLGKLLHERLGEDELRGLREDKLNSILSFPNSWRRGARHDQPSQKNAGAPIKLCAGECTIYFLPAGSS